MLKPNPFSDAPILAVTEKYRRHPETLKIEALVLTCIVRVSNSITIIMEVVYLEFTQNEYHHHHQDHHHGSHNHMVLVAHKMISVFIFGFL